MRNKSLELETAMKEIKDKVKNQKNVRKPFIDTDKIKVDRLQKQNLLIIRLSSPFYISKNWSINLHRRTLSYCCNLTGQKVVILFSGFGIA